MTVLDQKLHMLKQEVSDGHEKARSRTSGASTSNGRTLDSSRRDVWEP